MSLIEYPTPQYDGVLANLANRFLAGEGLLFLGAGVNANPGHQAFPIADGLSEIMARGCGMDWPLPLFLPLSQIAFYFEAIQTRASLNQLLVETFDRDDVPVSPALANLMKLIAILQQRRLETIAITTNYDRQFEKAYLEAFSRSPEIVIYKGAADPNDRDRSLNRSLVGDVRRGAEFWLPRDPETAVLYKMHGCISQPEEQGLVITEEDYINFLANAMSGISKKAILTYARGALTLSTILFIGYSLSDWNFRVIFKATVESQLDKKDTKSYAVQYRDPNKPGTSLDDLKWRSAIDFWNQKKVDIINVPGDQFTQDLIRAVISEDERRSRTRERINEPQRTIA
jgi:hypothetical protein